MRDETLLITGGTGFIGSRLIKQLKSKNEVTVLTRQSHQSWNKLGHDVHAVNDLSNVDFNHIDHVINLAGEPIADKRWTNKQKQRICRSRWQITQELVDAINACSNPPKTFISGSAIGYYGRQDDKEIDETFSSPYPEFSHQICKTWEEIAQQVQPSSTRLCILRTGIVLSRKQGALKKMMLPFKLGFGGPIGNGQQYMSWIHIDDMVDLIETLLENEQFNGIYNATAPNPVTNNEFTSTLACRLNRPGFMRMPSTIAKLLFGELSDLLIHGQRVVPSRLIQQGFHFRYKHLDDAIQHILR